MRAARGPWTPYQYCWKRSTSIPGLRVTNSTFFTPSAGTAPSLTTCSSVMIRPMVERSMNRASSAWTVAYAAVPARARIAAGVVEPEFRDPVVDGLALAIRGRQGVRLDVPANARQLDDDLRMGGPPVGLEGVRSEEHTSELQSPCNLVCRLLLEKKKNRYYG